MEDTIIALLNNNLRVIIPDFGAFIIRQKQPRIIVFNEFLRYNDGILIDFIVKTEGIDRDIAEQRVLDFAEDGSKLLASGRELKIEGLGSLRKDSSGKINFIEASEIIEIENKDAAVVENREFPEEKQEVPREIGQEVPPEIAQEAPPEIVQEVPQEIEQEVPQEIEQEIPQEIEQDVSPAIEQEIPKVIELEVTKATEPKKPGKHQSKSTARTKIKTKSKTKKAPAKGKTALRSRPLSKTIPSDVPLEVIEPAAAEIREAVEAPPAESQSVQARVDEESRETEPPKTVVPPPPVKPPQDYEPSMTADRHGPVSTNRILAWVLIILFVNAAILAWFVFRNKTKGTPAGKTVTTMISDSLYDQLADSVRAAAMDSSIVYDEVPVEEGNPAVKAMAPGSRYYIVAGCFRDEVNADSLVTSLKLLGYKAEKFGKIGNLYAVCFASFDNKDKAVSELKKIREKIPSAWMTKF